MGSVLCFAIIISSIIIENAHLSKLSRRAITNFSTAAINATTLPNPAITKCKDNNWVFHKSKCYRVFNTFEYFTSAIKICQDNGAKLVSIEDAFENRVIEEIVKTDTRYTEAWIGLRIEPPATEYAWVDKTKNVYSNWLFERPNNEGRCAQIIPGGYWSNTLCYRKLQFVCKRAEVVPVDKDDKTKLIIMVTLPMSCVVIMLVFISYLCFRSHEEMKSIRVEEKKISQHFVDVVANNATVAEEKPDIVEAYQEHLKEREEENLEEENDAKYKGRRNRAYSSPNGEGKMYKQVTFV